MYQRLTLVLLLLLSVVGLSAQVTTGTINGTITGQGGNPLPGASVTVTLTTTGVSNNTVTKSDGRFTVPNLRVGGPYTVVISNVGYQQKTVNDVFVSLGTAYQLDEQLEQANNTLGSVTVVGQRNGIISNRRTGLATQVTNEQIRNLPTISRSATDYTRLTPSADGISFAGRNSQYNNFSLDGAVFNNPFGLDAATPGGQTDAQAVSLDAIEQIQVAIAPYDVTQGGFTGASVNSVTKSGTNLLRGTVYGFYRNQDLTGSKVGGTSIVVPQLKQAQGGFALGGAIIKNKLFFFVNGELDSRTDAGSNWLAARPGLTGANVSRVLASDLDAVSAALARIGYQTGSYENYLHDTKSNKGLVKLDWNVNSKHSVAFTYNFLDASKDKNAHPSAIGRRGPDATTLQFYNSGYRINNKLNNFAMEVRSNFNNTFSNKLRAVYTTFRDKRDPFSAPMPVLNIQKDGIRYIVAGHEPFSINNNLNQDAFQVTNNLNIFLNKHTLTVGGSFEKFAFDNSFNLTGYGFRVFGDISSVADLITAVNNGSLAQEKAAAEATFAKGQWNWAYTNVGQAALYAQDEVNLHRNFRLTYGLRVDMPLYFDTESKIIPNTDPVSYFDENGNRLRLDNTKMPEQKPLVSPRVGFNWDVRGDKSLQVRGGSGLFTGRFPFVWVGNQVANPFTGYLNVTAPDFKWPQVWRNNLGADYRLGNGWIATVDLAITKDVNAMMVRNYALGRPTGQLNGVDKRAVYTNSDKAIFNGGLANAYVFDNVNTGNQLNISGQLQRFFGQGFYAMVGYNYLNAKDASSISAEISGDAFDRNPAFGNVNQARNTPSLYGNKHRFVGAGYKKFTYGPWATTVSLFAQYAKGGRFAYTYSGDLNGDGSGLNDLLYIPTETELNGMQFSGTTAQQAAQRSAYNAYINQDEYMSGRRGQYAEKYAALSPWYSQWDLRILQDFQFKTGKRTNTIQFSADVLNVGNLLSSDWGVRQFPVNTQPVGVSVVNNTPVYSFDTSLKNTFINDFSLLSRYQVQFGLRYIF